jgi:hypothetical protein
VGVRRTAVVLLLAIIVVIGLLAYPRLRELLAPSPKVPEELLLPPEVEDDLGFDPATLDATDWVRQFDPDSAYGGYTLGFYKARIPIIIDMNGNIVHSWPDVRATARLRLREDGHLLLLCVDKVVREYDWEGNIVWAYSPGDTIDFPHHDLIRLRSGNVLMIYRHVEGKTDYLVEVDRAARVVWTWRASEKLRGHFEAAPRDPGDLTHINSVQELPSNRWYDEGDARFRPGNLLISPRQLNAVFIIDKRTGDVVWSYDHQLDCQHEALMIPKGHPGEGNILVFNNGHDNLHGYRRSSVEEINPRTNAVEWQYSDQHFFSSVGGVEQSLPNGNVLIVSSAGWRAFEVTRSGTIVWEWAPPFRPMRAERYPYDYCAELEQLGAPPEHYVAKEAKAPHVDRDLYKFVLPTETELFTTLQRGERKLRLLTTSSLCRTVLVPPIAVLRLGFGVPRDEAEETGGADGTLRFVATLTKDGTEVGRLDRELSLRSDRLWRTVTIPLRDHALEPLELCLDIQRTGALAASAKHALGVWENPSIVPRQISRQPPIARRDSVSAVERRHREEQLKALGYVE